MAQAPFRHRLIVTIAYPRQLNGYLLKAITRLQPLSLSSLAQFKDTASYGETVVRDKYLCVVVKYPWGCMRLLHKLWQEVVK